MPKWVDLAQAGWRLWRLLDWRPIREQAETPLRVELLGSGPVAERAASLLAGVRSLTRRPFEALPANAAPDLVLLAPPDDRAALATATRIALDCEERGVASLLLVSPGTEPLPAGAAYVAVDPVDPSEEEQLASAIIEALPEDRRLAAAREAPTLRAPLARRLIQEVSFANAQFALVTNIPTLLPGLGTAAGVGADILVLTTNQIVLVYRLAALWGAPLGEPRAIIAEALPVVGGAFVWRTAARALVGALPAIAALAPKVGIAYVGTYLVGALASAYYERRLRPSPEQVREIEAEAKQALAEVWHRLRPGHPSSASELTAGPTPLRAPPPASTLPPPTAPREGGELGA
jgi:hypothetical protein